MAKMMANSSESWVEILPKATAAYNNTPKGPLHGDAPAEVREDPQVKFMLLQDNARKLQHNQDKADKRVEKLQESNAFRAPLPEATSKFKRSFQPTYGDVQKVKSIRGSTVTGQDGSKIDVKRIKIVPTDSGTAQATLGQNLAGPERKRLAAGPILVRLQELLEGRETAISLTKASQLLREQMRTESQSYDSVLEKAKARLVDIIRLVPEQFKLTVQQRAGLNPSLFYVSLRE